MGHHKTFNTNYLLTSTNRIDTISLRYCNIKTSYYYLITLMCKYNNRMSDAHTRIINPNRSAVDSKIAL